MILCIMLEVWRGKRHFKENTMRNKIVTIIISLVFVGIGMSSAWAAKSSVKLGAAIWDYSPDGTIGTTGTNADIKSSLNIEDDTDSFFWIAIEHRIPVLPNIKLVRTNLELDGSGTVGATFNFNGQTFNVNSDITSTVELNQTDVILYYKLVDSNVSFDLGINTKIFDGKASASSVAANANETVDFTGPVPMLYGNLSVKLPASGLSLGLEASGLAAEGHSISDIIFRVAYTTKSNIGFELGYRRLDIKLDDLDSINADISVDGPFFAVRFVF